MGQCRGPSDPVSNSSSKGIWTVTRVTVPHDSPGIAHSQRARVDGGNTEDRNRYRTRQETRRGNVVAEIGSAGPARPVTNTVTIWPGATPIGTAGPYPAPTTVAVLSAKEGAKRRRERPRVIGWSAADEEVDSGFDILTRRRA